MTQRIIIRILAMLGLLASVALLCLPFVRDALFLVRAGQTVQTVISRSGALTDGEARESLRQAESYNAWLSGSVRKDSIPQEELWPYQDQLAMGDGNGPMEAYVEVQKIQVMLPIYHGVSEEALMAGVGHLEGTSLPVGGSSSHCVLSGHSGMRSAHVFDELEDLVEGDTFVVWTLGRPYAYRVYATETVKPEEVTSLGLEAGRDLCTLVTCTDLADSLQRLNAYRLLVHGERCVYEVADETWGTVVTQQQQQMMRHAGGRLAVVGGATAVVLGAAIVAIVRAWRPEE